MNRGQMTQLLASQYAQRRREHTQEEKRRENEAVAKCPEIGQLISARRELMFKTVHQAVNHPVDFPDAQAMGKKLTDQMNVYSNRIRELLLANGFDEDYLQPIYTCRICKDTGYMGDDVKEICPCFQKAYVQLLSKDLGLSARKEQTFESWREDVISDEILPNVGVSQRTYLCALKKRCSQYAESYPNTRVPDMLLIGPSGLGKTFLMQAMARRVIERGFPALVVSAFKVVEMTRNAYFRNDPTLSSPLTDTPLLFIDDLGAEPLLENITVAQLFNLLNERQNAGLHTVISTNLTMDELSKRYTERISSRLEDKSQCDVLTFAGRDIRKNL